MPKYKHVKAKRTYSDRQRRESEEWALRLQSIKEHPETKVLSRVHFEAAYKYVEDMFPELAPSVSATLVYKNANTHFCHKSLRLPRNVGGVYMIKVGAILICHSTIPDDVVVVHEMLHFASHMLGSRLRITSNEENFAFSRSIPYLLQQGAGKEWIAKKYLLPYYTGYEMSLMDGRNEKVCQDKARNLALDRAYKLIESPLGETIEDAPDIGEDRFGMI